MTQWGIFLCTCRRTLSIEPSRLDLPTPYVQLANDPDTDLESFAALAKHARLDRALIGCCAAPSLFEHTLDATGVDAPTLHYVNLKEPCFWVHSDTTQAHTKASRLLRAAMHTAEVRAAPAYNPLHAGGRVLIITETALGTRLAQQLGDAARPVFVIDAERPGIEPRPGWRVYRGRVLEVQGRLGTFRVTLRESELSEPRELQADQVVMLSQNGTAPFKTRTGCYVLTNPSASEVDWLAERMRDLMGDFLKTVHVSYQTDICAGGTANQPACGRCIPACPYEAINRDAQNPLRMAVDHLACEGCGACVSACPTSALRFTEPSPRELYTHLAALLAPVRQHRHSERLAVLFHCGEQGRRVLDEAGKQSLHYPASVLPVEVPCLRYVSEANMLAAFRLGAAGVGLLGCDTCQHGERDLLYQQLDFCRLTLDAFAFGSDRVRVITAADGTEAEAITALSRFAEGLDEAPLPWDGQPIRRMDNREVIAETLARFMECSAREPGRRTFQASYPFAFAEVQESGCTLCRACVNVCPVHAFKLEAATSSLQYKHLACVACGLCETVCPEHVITLRQEVYFEPAALEYQTAVQDTMIACARCGTPYINRKALEAVEARLLSLDALLETFSGQRRALLRMCPKCRAVAAMLEVEKGWEP